MDERIYTGPGQLLAAARERMGMTSADVAKRLFLSQKFILAIENDTADEGTNSMFVRGYMRAYAKLVEVPLDEVMLFTKPGTATSALLSDASSIAYSAIAEQADGVSTEMATAQESSTLSSRFRGLGAAVLPSLKADPRFMMGGIAVFAALALVSVAYLFKASSMVESSSEEAVISASAEPASGEITPSVAAATDASHESEAALSAEPSVAAEPIVEQISAASAVLKGRSTYPAVLVFSATDKSWVTALDKNGDRIFARMVQRGESFELEGESPFKIILGNPKAIRLAYNGEAVKLNAVDKNNVVVTLGANAKEMNIAYLDEESNQLKPTKKDKRSR